MTQTLEVPIIHRNRSARPRRSAGELPPVILMGGRANALSVARSLGRIGAAVYLLNEPGAFVRTSRYCDWLDVPVARKGDEATAWADFLLSDEAKHLHGAVLLSCSDEGIGLIA